ncbi:ThuA domain-containing protein [Rapidithrix thailandica]|uniref:ThuA domain-containing protein n=2 Tax=Rapidithrix thailandica TaxID=413964 RepID=A0AAW9S452_9BACT
MKKLLCVIAWAMIGSLLCASCVREQTKQKRILVFSKTSGFRHASIGSGIEALIKLGHQEGFAVDTTEDASFFAEDSLQSYSAVVFLNTTGDVLNRFQQADFERYIQAGGGFVGIHAATDTEYHWPWFNQLIGAWFNGHPSNPNVRTGMIHRHDKHHPITKDLPDSWEKRDEFYDFKNFNEEVDVLLTVDEKSYGGGKHGDFHPITWCHEFDGGRAFYTNFGHTDETFSEPEFLKLLRNGIRYAIGDNRLDYAKATSLRVPPENRFVKNILADHLDEPMELEVLPNGKILFVERKGAVKLFDPATEQLKTLAQLDVHTKYEDGLLGLAIDPKFDFNGWLYLFYSPVGDVPKQHVSRFLLSGDSLILASEKVLLEIPVQRDECCHSAGSLEFGPDGNLFIAVGDNTSPFNTKGMQFDTQGFGPMDERPGRTPYDAQRTSGNTHDLRGKVLRINPLKNGSYAIPDGNLFAKDGSEGRPEIYVMGCRNPYRMAIDMKRGWLYWGDVGPDAANDDEQRGTRGYDEVNQARGPGNFGWPYFVGDNQTYRKMNYVTGELGPLFDSDRPENTSPNNTGAQILPPAHPAFIWYPYAKTDQFPHMKAGGRNAMAGPTYYYGDFVGSKRRLPRYYDQKVFVYDWMRNWIHAVTLDEKGNYLKQEPFLESFKFQNIVDVVLAKDGTLYMLEYGKNWFSANPDAVLSHIDYAEGNRNPVAKIQADKVVGAAPFSVNFSAENSFDFDENDALRFEWFFDGTGTVQSEKGNPNFVFEEPGIYQAKVKVYDSQEGVSEASIEIKVGNEPPAIAVEFVGNSTFYWGTTALDYQVNVTDKEDGTVDRNQVMVALDYLAIGNDLTLIEQGHQQKSQALDGAKLIKENACISCHAINEPSIGPSYMEVAKRYKGMDTQIPVLIKKIQSGGSGNWGERMMAANPQITEEMGEAIVKYIFSLTDENQSLPTEGTLLLDEHVKTNTYGKYIFTASYQDQGGAMIDPLKTVYKSEFRSPRVEAEEYDGFKNLTKRKPGGTNYMLLKNIRSDSYFMFKNIDLTGVDRLSLRTGSVHGPGYVVKVRKDKPDGEVIGTVAIPYTSGEETDWSDLEVKLKEVKGKCDVYFTFDYEGENPKAYVTVDWIFFHQAHQARLN